MNFHWFNKIERIGSDVSKAVYCKEIYFIDLKIRLLEECLWTIDGTEENIFPAIKYIILYSINISCKRG